MPCGTPAKNEYCCRYSNPCLNDGECVGFCPDSGKRFECHCSSGYYGDRCQHKPMTCQDYWNDPKPANGAYDLYDQTGVLYKAFCDFHTEEGLAWTLVLSRSRVTVLPPLLQDFPARNLASPENGVMWNEYSLARCGFIMF